MSEDELRDQLQGSDAFRGLMEALRKIADVARDGIEIFCDAIREEIVPLCRSVIDVFRELIGAVNRKEKTKTPRFLVRCIGNRPVTKIMAQARYFHRSGCRHK